MKTKSKGGSIDAARAAALAPAYHAVGGEYCNTVEGWCKDATISLPLYFKLRREGRGPITGQAGRRTPVLESPVQYYRRMAGLP
jgi:hypothetical protein